MTAQEQIAQFINQCIEGTDVFLVEFKVKPSNVFKVFLDADSGFTLEKCIKINRSLRRMVEEADLYPEGNFSFEVSSPGVDVPLKLNRQYVKNIGRNVEIELNDEEAMGITGKLIAVNDDFITVEKSLNKKEKKKEIEAPKLEIPFATIKQTLVAIEF